MLDQKDRFRISLQTKVDNPSLTMDAFKRRFQLNEPERKAVLYWARPQEAGETMFNVVNIYTKMAQFPELSAEFSFIGYKKLAAPYWL